METEKGLLSFAEEFYDEVLAGTHDSGPEGHLAYKEEVFTVKILDHFVEIGLSTDAAPCYFDRPRPRKSIKVNGFSIDEEREILDLFITIFFHDAVPHTIQKKTVDDAIKHAYNFYQATDIGLDRLVEPSSEAYGMIQRIIDFRKCNPTLRVFVLTNGITKLKKTGTMTSKRKNHEFEVQIWDMERLYRSMQAKIPKEEIEVNFYDMFDEGLKCLPMIRKPALYESFLSIIPGDWLFHLYEEFGPGLLEFNVRSFLQVKGKVNKGIRKTLKDDPESFMAYNNGLSATVDQIEFEEVDGQRVVKSVKGLQIVNGGQTTVSIHRAGKKDKIDLSRVQVPVKITWVEPDHMDVMVPQISLYANSQNPVNVTDFSSNDRFQIEVEHLSRKIWTPNQDGLWFYERARGQYSEEKDRKGYTQARRKEFSKRTPTTRKITKTDLAKYVQAWDQKPHLVSFGGQKNFVHFQQSIRGKEADKDEKEWLPDETWYKDMVAKAILFKRTHLLVRRRKFKGYMANITCYLVSYLSHRFGDVFSLSLIWEKQEISDELYNLLDGWAPEIQKTLVDSSAGRNVTEWCKKEACWEVVKELSLDGDFSEVPEILQSDANGQAPPDPDGEN